MIKLPNSIEPAVMAENIVHLRDGLAAVDAKTLPATTTATTGQILKLTGENKTPSWSDEYSYTPPAYSETEVNTGQKWIDGRNIYSKVVQDTLPVISGTVNIDISSDLNLENAIIIKKNLYFENNNTEYIDAVILTHDSVNGTTQLYQVGQRFSEYNYTLIVEYVKNPVPGDAKGPEDDEEPEEKKTTKKKTTK